MNGQRFHEDLLDRIEAELAMMGCSVTATARERMAGVLKRLDRATSDDLDRLGFELGFELDEIEEEITLLICPPARWLPVVECA